ncbi:aldo/keto reductase [Burkholderia sp. BCC1993]|uniref:aldo/keto reductase n=1 Tax=Burkholderia sp. BCC1993 TaxID=2817444 RepID=UPI002AB2A82F|nr:aldo/keto reductase [Burkholderia sp. BCC1993]
MRYKLFGRSGLRVSELCLGTMTFGADWGWGADDAESRAMFDAFANAGGNFIDTANVYTGGSSERLVGDCIKADRDHFVVATKYTPSVAGDLVKAGNSRKNMLRSVEESLRRLGTDHIDLYYLHFWDDTTPLDEIMRGLDDLVRAGKVTYIAFSDTPAWRIGRACLLADLRGWSPLIGIQVEYSLLERTAERELLPMARELDLGVTAWSPLAQGVLTGKFIGAANASHSRQPAATIPESSQNVARLVVEIAREASCTPGQAALAALRQLAPLASFMPILGARSVDQLRENLACLEVRLTPEQLERLDAATAIAPGFPHALLAAESTRSFATGGSTDSLDNHRQRACHAPVL